MHFWFAASAVQFAAPHVRGSLEFETQSAAQADIHTYAHTTSLAAGPLPYTYGGNMRSASFRVHTVFASLYVLHILASGAEALYYRVALTFLFG